MRSIREMDLREKVGQLFVLRPEGLLDALSKESLTGPGTAEMREVTEQYRERYQARPCGGFCLFRRNLENPAQLISFTAALHDLGPIRPLIFIDEEGGSVARIANHPGFPDIPRLPQASEIGATGDSQAACEAGRTIGTYLKEFGIDVDFAPVADVYTNPENTVVRGRTYGTDPAFVALLDQAFLKGLHEAGVYGCLKHFPGHGDTREDTHLHSAETLKSWEELCALEMVPFKAGIADGVEMIMSAHIAAPKVTGNTLPATLSPVLLTEKLRKELGFKGLVLTDDLEMEAVSGRWNSAEACILSLLAGADILLLPYDYAAAFDGVLEAVQTGRIPEERIDGSVSRILAFKEKITDVAGCGFDKGADW